MNQLRNELMMDSMNENNYAPAQKFLSHWMGNTPLFGTFTLRGNQKGHNFKSKGDKK